MNDRPSTTLGVRLTQLTRLLQRISSAFIKPITRQVKSIFGHQHCYLCHQYSCAIVCRYCLDRMAETGFGQHRSATFDLLRNPATLKNLDTPNYDHLYAIDNYVWPLNKLVLDMKFGQKSVAARALTSLFFHFVYSRLSAQTGIGALEVLANSFQNPRKTQHIPQLLVPVPLSNKRYWQRQYNQAQLLCEWLSKATLIPNKAIVQRVKHTRAQSRLDKEQRIENVSNAFRCDSVIRVQHIALIDDVITTGVTINAVCQAIKKHNPKVRITVWTMAITLLK